MNGFPYHKLSNGSHSCNIEIAPTYAISRLAAYSRDLHAVSGFWNVQCILGFAQLPRLCRTCTHTFTHTFMYRHTHLCRRKGRNTPTAVVDMDLPPSISPQIREDYSNRKSRANGEEGRGAGREIALGCLRRMGRSC